MVPCKVHFHGELKLWIQIKNICDFIKYYTVLILEIKFVDIEILACPDMYYPRKMVPHKNTDSTVYLTSLTGKMVCHAKASPDLTANVQTISEDLLQNVWISLDLTSVFIFVSHHRGCMTLFQGNVTVYLFYPLFIHIFACFLTGSLHVFTV